MPRWTEEQSQAINLEGCNILVSAGAGSGKTAVLSERALRKVKEGVNIDEVLIGRNEEIDSIIEVLCCKNKNNPILIGDAGVGKTAIVEELASRINCGNVPNILKNKKKGITIGGLVAAVTITLALLTTITISRNRYC